AISSICVSWRAFSPLMAFHSSGSAWLRVWARCGPERLQSTKARILPPRPMLRRSAAKRLPRSRPRVNLQRAPPGHGVVAVPTIGCRSSSAQYANAFGGRLVTPPFAVAADRPDYRADRPRAVLADPGHGGDQRGQRRGPQGVQLQLEQLSRSAVVSVLGGVPPRRRLYAVAQRARSYRRHFRKTLAARTGVDRHFRDSVFSAADGHPDRLARLAGVRRRLRARRGLDQCRRTDHLAGAPAGPDRLFADCGSGHLGDDQANCIPDRTDPRSG